MPRLLLSKPMGLRQLRQRAGSAPVRSCSLAPCLPGLTSVIPLTKLLQRNHHESVIRTDNESI